jgi:ATP-dependent DNA helicase RecG
MQKQKFEALIKELIKLPKETEWLEFKHNNSDPKEIGENISAISNASALARNKACGYLIWGVNDQHEIVGTTFNPKEAKVGNEELENWILRLLDPNLDLRIYEENMDGKKIVIFEIPVPFNRPIRFNGIEYLRVGSYTKKLHDFPEKERALWRLFDKVPFENGIAKKDVTEQSVLDLLDYPNYFRLMNLPLPENRQAILERLISEKVIMQADNGLFDIMNVGAVLYARSLQSFERLARKAIRVIFYKGSNRVETIREQQGDKGYAIGFPGVIGYINDHLPQNEEIGSALREEVKMFPPLAIRELVANAIIHQDFNVTGAGPTIEIFNDRMEITNPGVPLIDTLRFIDEPPRSRNEKLASLMRRMAICEERGSGIDKVIFHVELFQLPAPDFRVATESTIAVLYGPRKFAQMNREERIRACYQHACLQYVSGQDMTNASLRTRLGIKASNYPAASRIIKDTIANKLIKPKGSKDSGYLPFWA